MILLEEEPTLTELHRLIDRVPNYPLSVRQLIDLANLHHAPQPVIDFYSAFPEDETFDSEEDLLARTESVEILQHQDAPEEMHVPQED